MEKQHHVASFQDVQWVPLSTTLKLIFSKKKLFSWSAILVLLTFGLTWTGYLFTVDFVDELTGNFMATAPDSSTIWGWIKHQGWVIGSWFFLIISRIFSFYIAFLLAYTLTTPGYAFLSSAAEKIHAGEYFDPDASFTLGGIFIDMFEGFKIACFGILITIAALFVNFIPGIGQAAVFLLYTYYSALMFIDYPGSRRRWGLGRKLSWLREHSSPAFRLGVGPALISMIPILNIFAMALLFPVLTVHATLNFSAIEVAKKIHLQP